jgi:hypothetical protein
MGDASDAPGNPVGTSLRSPQAHGTNSVNGGNDRVAVRVYRDDPAIQRRPPGMTPDRLGEWRSYLADFLRE